MTNGLLLEVRADDRASAATAAVAIGATSVPVENLTPFDDDGGKVDIAGVVYDYTGIDESTVNADGEGGSVLLASALTVAVEEFDPVSVIVGGQVAVDIVAVVDLGEDDTDGEYVEVPLDTREERVAWPVGPYDPPLPVTLADDLSGIIAAPSVMPVLDGSIFDPNTLPKTPGQTFSTDPPPADATGYAEDFAWWQVVDGEVQGFWRVVGGAWVAQDVVTADALTAKNALIDALNATDGSFVNLSGVNIDGGSIAIAANDAAAHPQAFSGTTLPAGWTYTPTITAPYTAPGMSVISSGYPSGGSGSVLLTDFGPAGQTDGAIVMDLTTDYSVTDFEATVKFQWDLHSDSGVFPNPAIAKVHFCATSAGEYRLYLNQNAVDFREVITSGTERSIASQAINWVDGAWYWAKVRKVAGSVSVTAWRDGTTAGKADVGQLSTALQSGPVFLRASEGTLLGASDGNKLWIDELNVTGISTGFKVNPDGTGEWPALAVSSGDLSASGAFTGTANFTKIGSVVVGSGNINRATGFNTSFVNTGIVVPASMRPKTALTLPASPFFGVADNYRFKVNTDGTLQIQQSAASTQNMSISASWPV